jgi:hypothetical protein
MEASSSPQPATKPRPQSAGLAWGMGLRAGPNVGPEEIADLTGDIGWSNAEDA